MTEMKRFRALVVLGALVLVGLLQPKPLDAGFFLFLAMAVLSERMPLVLPRYGPISLADAVAFAMMCLYGPLATVVTVVASGLSRFAREGRVRPEFIAYSLSQSVLSYGTAACLFQWARRSPELLHGRTGLIDVFILSASVVAGFLLHSCIVSIHQWLEQGKVGVWTSRFNVSRLRLMLQGLMPLGMLMAVAQQESVLATFLLMGPLVVTYLSIRNYTETLREAQHVIESLAEAVEKREPHTIGHASRVATLATDVARHLRLSEAVVRSVASAARLHELGKISLGDQILCKSGALKATEWEKVRRYPEVGAQVAQRLSLSRREAEYIRYHQEWYNGAGYPYGLKGEQIPMGSRILAVAKAFDAMLSQRAFRKPMTLSQALSRLQEASGTQFDPRVVEALLATLRRRQTLKSA